MMPPQRKGSRKRSHHPPRPLTPLLPAQPLCCRPQRLFSSRQQRTAPPLAALPTEDVIEATGWGSKSVRSFSKRTGSHLAKPYSPVARALTSVSRVCSSQAILGQMLRGNQTYMFNPPLFFAEERVQRGATQRRSKSPAMW